MFTNRFLPCEVNEMVRRYLAGESSPQIAKAFRTTDCVVGRYLRKRGVPIRPHTSSIPQHVRDGMVSAYLAGDSIEEAASRYGLSRKACENALRDAGAERRPLAEVKAAAGLKLRVAPEVEEEVIRRYAVGETAMDVARALGISGASVGNIVRRHGQAVRPLYESCRSLPLNDRFFTNIATEEQAWLLGFITADGCVTCNNKGHYTLAIGLARRDREIIVRIKDLLGSGAKIHDLDVAGGRCIGKNLKPVNPTQRSSITFSSKRLVYDLIALGVTPRKSLTATPWNGPHHLMRHYWRGMVDGDGWIARGGNEERKRWNTGLCGSEACVKAFAEFVNAATGSKANVYQESCKPIYRILYGGGPLVRNIIRLLYAESIIHLLRKKLLAEQLLATFFHSDVPSMIFPKPTFIRLTSSSPAPVTPHVHPSKWEFLTQDVLLAMYREEGDWSAVARRLSIGSSYLVKIRKRLGMPLEEGRSWKDITKEQLQEAHTRLGTWRRVSLELNIRASHLCTLRRSLGIDRESRDWSSLSNDVLLEMFHRLGTWAAVGRELGMSNAKVAANQLARRRGLK